jgi:hypothetical protein
VHSKSSHIREIRRHSSLAPTRGATSTKRTSRPRHVHTPPGAPRIAEAVTLVDTAICARYTACARSHDFAAYIDDLRAAHKPKLNLIKLLDELHPAPPPSTL